MFPLPRAARAEPSSEQSLVAAYSAEPGCPDRAAFEQRVRVRLGSADADVQGRRFDVRFSREGAGARGRLQLVGHDTAQARELSAASCSEAADALALVAALMLRDLSQPASPARGAAARGSARGAEARSAAHAPQSDARVSAQPNAPAARAEQAPTSPNAAASDESASVNASQDTDRLPSPLAEPASPAIAPAPVAPRGPFFSKPRLALFVSGLAAWRVAPHVRPGLGLGLSLSALTRAGPRVAAQLGVRATLPDLVRSEQGRAQFVWVAGTGALCVEGPERRLRASACGVAELGAIRASGAAATGRGQSRFWGALGPSLAGSLAVHERAGLRLSGELLGILVRDRFFLADRVVYSVPRLAFRAELALWVTIL